jgi:hypothetical protein
MKAANRDFILLCKALALLSEEAVAFGLVRHINSLRYFHDFYRKKSCLVSLDNNKLQCY